MVCAVRLMRGMRGALDTWYACCVARVCMLTPNKANITISDKERDNI